MKTRPTIDRELLELVHDVDPVRDATPVHLDTEMELAWRRLASQLDAPARRPRTGMVPALVAGGGVAVAAAAVAIGSGAGEPGAAGGPVTAQRAAMIIKHVRHALLVPSGQVLEQDAVTRTVSADGSSVLTSDEHTWVSTTAPYDRERGVSVSPGHPTIEYAHADGRMALYDASTQTIYNQAPPSYDISPGPQAGTEELTVPKATRYGYGCPGPVPAGDTGTVTLTISSAQADALRQGTATVEYEGHSGPGDSVDTQPTVVGQSPLVGDDPNVTSTIAEIRYLLTNPSNTVTDVTFDGEPAIRIDMSSEHATYWAAASDYRPLQLELAVPTSAATSNDGTTSAASTTAAAGTMDVTRYPIYRLIPADTSSMALMSLTAQHPDAKVVTDGAAYRDAECRLLTDRSAG